jgi:hypothetical protein
MGDNENTVYDKTDFDLMRSVGVDVGGPVNWTPGQYQSMGLAEHAVRNKYGGNHSLTIRMLIRSARNAFMRERNDDSQCPWDEEYKRRAPAARVASLQADLRTPPPATAKEMIVDFLARNGMSKRTDVLTMLLDRRYSESAASNGLADLVAEKKIYRAKFGWYANGLPPKPKKPKVVKAEPATESTTEVPS